MLISLLLLVLVSIGGFAITYHFDEESPLMWRLAAGNIIGSAICGTAGFVLALAFGLNIGVLIGAMIIAVMPVLIFQREGYRRRFRRDWVNAKGKLQGASTRKFLRFAYYAAFFVLFFFFFDRAMLESAAGIFTGGSQNLGDLPFHLGAIYSFTEGNNFPPENPSFSGARFSYPFIADFLTAAFMQAGAMVRDAMFVQNVAWAFSLLIILERFVVRLTKDRLAARIAPALLFFSGGLGFLWFFSDYLAQGRSFLDFISQIPKDYTIGDGFRWGNSMVVLFITQRSLLLGMPLTLVVLGYLWKVFDAEESAPNASASPRATVPMSPIMIGSLAGLLPLIHLHSLAVLFVVGVFLLILKPEKWITLVLFAGGVAIIAIPELIWSISGSASETGKFFAWHFGWDKGEANFFWFWFMNTGLFIPLLLAGLYFYFSGKGVEEDLPQSRKDAKKTKLHAKTEPDHSPLATHRSSLIWFYAPFAFLFLVSNTAKLAPWEWDNIKVLIYWFVGSIPFVAWLISWLWRKDTTAFKFVAGILLAVLVAAGALDVWRTVSDQINNKVFDADAVELAEQIKRRTPPKSMFLNAPTYNTAIVLTGRRSLMRYPGHLSSHGIDYSTREAEVKRMYQGSSDALQLLEKHAVDYVLISPEERNSGGVNEQFLARFPIAAESGQYRVHKIR